MSNRNGNRVVRERERLDFAKIKTTVQIPNLIDVQKKSYQRFLQMDLLPSEQSVPLGLNRLELLKQQLETTQLAGDLRLQVRRQLAAVAGA